MATLWLSAHAMSSLLCQSSLRICRLRSNLARLLGSRIRQHGVLCHQPLSMNG
ncbi:hypothetical protein K466DRAFT_592971, partial [Polyporus arcularius HHB13444]